MSSYKILNNQSFSSGKYSIVPIRSGDRYEIMKWRNEQIYHLRQNRPLTQKDQDVYFDTVVAQLFENDKPAQVLFSYLEDNICIGYGGMVHINWKDKHAEVSFIMKTELEQKGFKKHWGIFLELLEKVAFRELDLHKLHTYAFNLRPKIYEVLEAAGFKKEAVLKEHCLIHENYIDVIIHSKFNKH
ncbi:GNAT family N-acetyltransferase [Zunongwangia sp. H14]|uniref:GNAT family N-acetyltransferase n=1 Tax=Zunongwangia sp. H14 TaxID=3240792 RepID=UPI0035616473